MTFRPDWTERAQQEFLSALAYIAEENPANAQIVKERVEKTIGHLELFSLGLPAPKGTQKIYVPKTPYFVIFRRNSKGEITICAFLHSSRDWEQYDWDQV
jgi:plasmid stabilization system protein ParE